MHTAEGTLVDGDVTPAVQSVPELEAATVTWGRLYWKRLHLTSVQENGRNVFFR